MKTQIITIFTIILSITVVSAIYSGECESIEFPNIDDVNWSVEGNSSDMYGFTYNKTGTNITYCFHPLYKPDNFTITFYNYQEVVVDDSPPPTGGGSCSYNKNFDWNCSKWNECIDGEQIRDCKEYNNCHNKYGRPNVTQSCVVDKPIDEPTDEEPIEETTYKKYKAFIWIGIMIILIVLAIWIRIKTKKLKEKKKKS